MSTASTAQWIGLTISNKSQDPNSFLTISELNLKWGKLYRDGNVDTEISTADVVGRTISSGNTYTIWSSGRSNSPTGTEGTVVLKFEDSDIVVAEIYWDVPWAGENTLRNLQSNTDWIVDIPQFSHDGAIGEVTVQIVEA